MKLIEKIKELIKNKFNKNEKVKMLENPQMQNIIKENDKTNNDFRQLLKINVPEAREIPQIKTLICEGDGLGIKPKMSS